jgi:hypothetical protein
MCCDPVMTRDGRQTDATRVRRIEHTVTEATIGRRANQWLSLIVGCGCREPSHLMRQ